VVHPVTLAEYPQVALRPHHAVMSLAKARSTGFVRPDWHEALAKFMADYSLLIIRVALHEIKVKHL